MARGARKAALTGFLSLWALLSLTACGLVGGGGPSQEEFDAISEKHQNTKGQLRDALTQINAEKGKAAAARKELDDFKARAEQERSQAAVQALEGRISIERARLEAVRYAQTHLEVYSRSYRNVPLVWEVESATEDEEFYYINLTYQPFTGFEGSPGQEEFLMDKTGKIEFRQVLSEPKAAAPPPQAQGGG